MSNSERSLAASALFAGGPISDGRYPLARMLEYGQFIGVWDFDWRGRRSDGEWQTAEGEWHFYWALEGRAVCDTWIIPKLAARRQPEAPAGEYGLTVRFFDPAVDAWRVTWNGPVNGNVRRFTAQVRGSEIVQDSLDELGTKRWVFADITPDSFRWRSELSHDQGQSWDLIEEMLCRRRR